MAPTEEKLEYLYRTLQLSGRKIARLLNIPYPTVFSRLKRRQIKLRTRKESALLEYHNHPEGIKKAHDSAVVSLTGKKQNPDWIRNRVASREGYSHSPATREKIGQALKGRKWSAQEREKNIPIVMRNRFKRPTSLELAFQAIVDKYNLPYKYVGDGYTFIAGRCPDYLNVNGQKLVVEIFSRWWHDPRINPKVKPQHTEEATVKHYAQYGFRCLIIWEEELEDENKVLSKVGMEYVGQA
jgi:G:T-mismatch repair DNA endonuclease (very short patch repair protein)